MTEKLLYSFHPEAVEQQTDIWIYTCQHWGEEQADIYIDGLHDKLSIVAHDCTLLRKLPNGIHPQVNFFHYERHYVFLKIASSDCPEKFKCLRFFMTAWIFPSNYVKSCANLLDQVN